MLGTFILKPDFFVSSDNYRLLRKELNNCDLYIARCYMIEKYVDKNTEYRKRDLRKRFKTEKEFEKNFVRTKISFEAYDFLFPDARGVLIVVMAKRRTNKKNFYLKLKTIKEAIRANIKKNRQCVYLHIDEGDTYKIIKAREEEFDKLSRQYKNIGAAFVNGIHLEDYELFKSKFCYKTFKNLEVIRKENLVPENYITTITYTAVN